MSLEFTTFVSDERDLLTVRAIQAELDRYYPGDSWVDSEHWLVTPLTTTDVRAQPARISTNAGSIAATHCLFTSVGDKSAAGAAIEQSLRLVSAACDMCASDFATIYCGGPLVAASIGGQLHLDSKSGFWSVPGRTEILRGPAIWLTLRARDVRKLL